MTPDQMTAEIDHVAERLATDAFVEPLDATAVLFYEGVDANFVMAQGPDGMMWPPRKEEDDGHPLLIDSGALLEAATHSGVNTDNRAATFRLDTSSGIPSVLYGYVHNNGTRHDIPQREFFFASEDTLDAIADTLADEIETRLFV